MRAHCGGVLALVSVSGSIHYRVLPGLWRDDLLRDPGVTPADETDAWWCLSTAIDGTSVTTGDRYGHATQ